MGEVKLAVAVIDFARRDFINPRSDSDTLYECYTFLTGKSPMSNYFFGIAEIPFLKGGMKALRARLILLEEKAQAQRDELNPKRNRG